jgi:membrane protein
MPKARRALEVAAMLRRALVKAFEHDGFYLAQSSAYSAMVALFPALVFIAALISRLPDVAPLKLVLANFFIEVLPADVLPVVTVYFDGSPQVEHSNQALVVSAVVSLIGASGVLTTIMEGLRRAAGLPAGLWGFWRQRLRALLLVALGLVPLALATVLVMFGQIIAAWVTGFLAAAIQPAFFRAAQVSRWTIALAGVTALTELIYHWGVPRVSPATRISWRSTLPGAIVATAIWFVSTLVFGWYVTRFANYSQVYGSLGAAIALLFWLFLVFLSVLCGAEFNAQWSAAARSQ